MSVNIVNKSTGALTKIAGNPVEQASGISYDHTSSGMQANNVQAAVDELRSGLNNNVFKSGDIISATISDGAITTFGFIQHQTQVYVIIPVNKPISASTFTVTDIESFYVRYDGHLVDALANMTGTVNPTIMSNGCLQFTANFDTGTFSGIEHMPAIFTINAKITFS